MAKRFKNFRNSKKDYYSDEWGDVNEERRREKQKKGGAKYQRRNRREEKFQSYKDWRNN